MNQGYAPDGAIRTLIVDDEEPARGRLRQMLSAFDDVVVVAEAADGDAALQQIRQTRPDLVFLDIQMPGRNGLEVIAALAPPRPRVVFCTAYDRYAVEAFEHHALDYLLKPVNRQRLAKALDRVRETILDQPGLAQDLRRAEETQSRLFPSSLPQLRTLAYSGVCKPARGIGGDYYDFVRISEHSLAFVMGDVSGKGIAAALLMASLQGQVQSRAPLIGANPGELVAAVNRSLCSYTNSGSFVTFFYGVYDDSSCQFKYVNAGHNPPLLFRAERSGREYEQLEAGGIVMGVLPEAAYEEGNIALEPGDLLVLFTDGLTEAMNTDEEEFGLARVTSSISGVQWVDCRRLCEHLLQEVEEFSRGRPAHDDLTLIVARRNSGKRSSGAKN